MIDTWVLGCRHSAGEKGKGKYEKDRSDYFVVGDGRERSTGPAACAASTQSRSFKQNQQNCITVNPVMPQCVGFLVEQMDAAKRSEIEIKTKDVTGAAIKPPCSRYLFEAKGTSYTIRCEP